MTRIALLCIALIAALAACAPVTEPMGVEDPFAVPQPFKGQERNDAMIDQAIEAPAIVVEAPQGLNAEIGVVLRDQVIAAAQKRDVPALSQPTPRAWILSAQTATVAGAATASVISWRLVDASGAERAQFPVTFEGDEARLSEGGVRLLAEDTASKLEAALLRPTRQAGAPEAALASAPVAWVGAVNGAPGDGNTALARALEGVLPLKGVRVVPDKGKAQWRVVGSVKVAHKSATEDAVTLTWRVLDSKGKEAGTIAQENTAPRGRLSKPWAEVAGFAAEAAAEGIAQLLQQLTQGKDG